MFDREPAVSTAGSAMETRPRSSGEALLRLLCEPFMMCAVRPLLLGSSTGTARKAREVEQISHRHERICVSTHFDLPNSHLPLSSPAESRHPMHLSVPRPEPTA